MWESPIESFVSIIHQKISEELDNSVMEEVLKVGFNVDKDELRKALEYDRDQYEKGYTDGTADATPRWISVKDGLPDIKTTHKFQWREGSFTKSNRVLCACKQKSGERMVKEGYCEAWDDGGAYWKIPGTIDEVTHWMPLPEPPKED